MSPEQEHGHGDDGAAARFLTLTAGATATGGTFVARHEGRVVFVRGTAPGETVTAQLLEDPREQAHARFWRAEALDVLEAGPDRAPTVWEEAGIDGVGGAEWAHIALPAQRRIASAFGRRSRTIPAVAASARARLSAVSKIGSLSSCMSLP